MKIRGFSVICCLAALVVVSGCTSTSVSGVVSSDNCVYIRDPGDWEPLDLRHLYLEDNSDGKTYLITTRSICHGLMDRVRIVRSDQDGRMCGNGADRLRYRHANLTQGCTIQSVQEVSSFGEALSLAEAD